MKRKLVIIQLLLVFVLGTIFPIHVHAQTKSVRFEFYANEQVKDKEWKIHAWEEVTNGAVYDLTFTKEGDKHVVTIPNINQDRLGFVIYYDSWVKEFGDVDRHVVATQDKLVVVNHGDANVQSWDAISLVPSVLQQKLNEKSADIRRDYNQLSAEQKAQADIYLNKLETVLTNFSVSEAVKLLDALKNTNFLPIVSSQLTVHFKKPADQSQYDFNIWTWIGSAPGREVAFTSTDDYGVVATIKEENKNLDKIEFKVRSALNTSDPWKAQSSANISVPLINGKNEIWLDGLGTNYATTKPVLDTPKPVLNNVEVKVHYIRSDNNYTGWNVYSWLRNSSKDTEGKATQLDTSHTATIPYTKADGIEKVGIIVRRSTADNEWAEKNTNEDLILDHFNLDGKREIWIVEKDAKIYDSYTDIQNRFTQIKLADKNVLEVTSLLPLDQATLDKVVVEGYTITNRTKNENKITLTLDRPVILDTDVAVSETTLNRIVLPLAKQYLHSAEFNEQYFYDGTLGAIYTKDATTFKLWAPTAVKAELVRYPGGVVLGDMTRKEDGKYWEYVFSGDADGMQYRYRLTFKDGTMHEAADPYSRAVSINGIYSVVVDSKNVVPENYSTQRMPAFSGNTDAIIYEAHVRDLTIAPDNGIQHKGKFLGLTEAETKSLAGNPTGLAYLKSLGVTHIQLLPIYDFASVDETEGLGYNQQYNWGYDPLHYNVPEGSYSTNPLDPKSRIKELKQMIQTIHENGMYVIMDVVYNHVYNVERSSLHNTVPGYYFRYNENNELHNGTGVGNETASEQAMYRKYMIDSLKYWATEYNIDGFRFDLMGIHDVDTMNQIRSEMNKIDPSMIILGEGWDMGNHPYGVVKANQYNADKMPGIAFFNDVFRDAVKGDNFKGENPGYVNKAHDPKPWNVLNSLKSQYVVRYISPDQNVLYNEAHDNYTVYDKLKLSNPHASEAEIARMHTHATSLQMLGNGIVFIHAGQEILRTKNGNHNSYKSSDDINHFDYDRQNTYAEELQYFKDLIKLRKQEPMFRMDTFTEINQKMAHIDGKVYNTFIGYTLNDENNEYYVLSNAGNDTVEFDLQEGYYDILVQNNKVYLENPEFVTLNRVSVYPNSITIVKKPIIKTAVPEVAPTAEALPILVMEEQVENTTVVEGIKPTHQIVKQDVKTNDLTYVYVYMVLISGLSLIVIRRKIKN